jgi:hypothetical protein
MFWDFPSGRTLDVLEERQTTTVNLPIDQSILPLTDNDAELQIISGNIPAGMRVEDTQLVGTPFEVVRDTLYEFVARIHQYGVFEDRTFSILVKGPDEPEWITKEGLLPVGSNEVYFILDSAPVDFQLIAIDPDTVAGDVLEYFILPGEGELPPGITLTKDGRLIGVTEPILEIEKAAGSGNFDSNNYSSYPYDFGITSDNGYDSFDFDTTKHDYSMPIRLPNKLNRNYEFVVTVSDGDTISKRKFRIYLVGDDYLRADNTILKVASGVFTADNSYIRVPVWLTKSQLGTYRANNYVTIFIDVIDLNTLIGLITYELLDTNPDGTTSQLPPGMKLDLFSGEIAGKVPYQSAVTKEYKFTLRALRRVVSSEEEVTSEKTFTIRIIGEIDSFIEWVTESDLGTIGANAVSNLNIQATTTLPNSILRYQIIKGKLPPGLTLSVSGDIIGKIIAFGDAGRQGITVFDSNSLTFDKNNTTVDRHFQFTVRVADRAGYSAIEKEFTLTITDPDDKIYSNVFLKPLLKVEQRLEYRELISNNNYFDTNWIYRLGDPSYGIQREMKMLLYSGIETLDVGHYVAAIAKNNKRKRYRLGDIKTAIAKNTGTQDVVYEIVYVEVIDPAQNNNTPTRKSFNVTKKQNITIDQTSYNLDRINSVERAKASGLYIITRDDGTIEYSFKPYFYVYDRDGRRIIVSHENINSPDGVVRDPNEPFRFRPNPENTIKADFDGITIDGAGKQTKYISNTYHARDNIRNLGETEIDYLPLWMRTSQPGQVESLGYTMAIPLCYTKPGLSKEVVTQMKRDDIRFQQFDFEVDRILIDSTTGIGEDSYLVYHNYSFNV